ncbi:CehA/McbA family metallohydrolase [Paenibacillus wulumuqiensis]|uniref:CehA/McbA family metallohydrolase n=1 Tax=Paenibacillus wulumuqiensis TaxID=1567107 RepID=UPI000619FDBB|nr:CehA/McbA family metallohydrolase [Paenibacillus wulumuqiensis]
MKKTWIASELHTHTLHSDGQQTLEELAVEARRLGLDCIALTDHNTQAGLLDRERMERETGVRILSGMEWTTFYGHMLTLGISRYIDWRSVGQLDIDRGIDEVHANDGIVGIAHPYRIGSPVCTGCYWEYRVSDWNQIDYIEVWSTLMPFVKRDSQRAFDLWTSLLNEGYRITATSGRDWHRTNPEDAPAAVTYLGTPANAWKRHDNELPAESANPLVQRAGDRLAIQAIRKGAAVITMGPLLTLTVSINGDETTNEYDIGATLYSSPNTNLTMHIQLDLQRRQEQYQLPGQHLRLVIYSDKGVLAEQNIFAGAAQIHELAIPVMSPARWLRAELYGCFAEVYGLLAFTNPVYFR